MPTRDIKTRFTLSGEKAWKQEMSQINGHLKSLKAELALSSSEFKGQANSMEALVAKQKLLREQYDQQREKVRAYREALTETRSAQERYAAAIDTAKRKATEAGIPLDKLRGSTKDLSEEEKKLAAELQTAERGYSTATKKGDEYRQSLAYAKIQLNNLDDELKKNQKYVLEAQKASDGHAESIDEFGREVDKAKDKTSSFGDELKANLASEAIISGIKALVGSLKDLAMESMEIAASYAANESQFTQTFGSMESEARSIIGKISDETGIMKERLNGSATGVYAFAKASGATTADAMSLMEEALTAAADAAAYYDRSLEDTTDTLQSFLKGNFANDAALGVSCTETTRNAAAMELFGQKYADLSEIQKQQTLLKMVTDAQKASGAIGQAARESSGWENVTGNLNATIDKLKAKLGEPVLEQVIPIIQSVTDSLDRLISGEIDIHEFIDELFRINDVTEAFRDWLPWISAITAALIAYKAAMAISKMVDTFTKATEGATLAQKMLNLVMNQNPFVLIATLLAAVVAAIVVLWNTNEGFRNAVTGAWNKLRDAASTVFGAIGKAISSIGSKFREIKDTMARLVGDFVSIGSNIVSGIWQGISNGYTWIKDKITGWVGNVVGFFKRVLGIHSPSTVMEAEVGIHMGEGATVGFVKGIDKEAMKKAIPTNFDIDAEVNTSVRYRRAATSGEAGIIEGGGSMVSGDASVISHLQSIQTSLDELKRMGLYLDGDRLVGGLTPKMDVALGKLKRDRERGC